MLWFNNELNFHTTSSFKFVFVKMWWLFPFFLLNYYDDLNSIIRLFYSLLCHFGLQKKKFLEQKKKYIFLMFGLFILFLPYFIF